MYDELVKMLRTCAERDSCIGWREACPYLGTGVCDNKAEKAADAIEELNSQLDDFKRLCLPLKENRLYKYSDGSFVEVFLILPSEPPKEG